MYIYYDIGPLFEIPILFWNFKYNVLVDYGIEMIKIMHTAKLNTLYLRINVYSRLQAVRINAKMTNNSSLECPRVNFTST